MCRLLMVGCLFCCSNFEKELAHSISIDTLKHLEAALNNECFPVDMSTRFEELMKPNKTFQLHLLTGATYHAKPLKGDVRDKLHNALIQSIETGLRESGYKALNLNMNDQGAISIQLANAIMLKLLSISTAANSYRYNETIESTSIFDKKELTYASHSQHIEAFKDCLVQFPGGTVDIQTKDRAEVQALQEKVVKQLGDAISSIDITEITKNSLRTYKEGHAEKEATEKKRLDSLHQPLV